MGGFEELDVGGESAGVSEKHANGDGGLGKFWQNVDCGGVEIEQAALVEQHRDRGCGQDFRDGGQIEDGVGVDFWRSGIVGEASEALGGEKGSAMGDCQRCSGEGALDDGVAQQDEGAGELGFLLVESRLQGTFRLRVPGCGLLIIACPRAAA